MDASAWWQRHIPVLVSRKALALLTALLAAVVAVCWIGVAVLGGLPGDAASAAEVHEHEFSWVALAPAHALDWLGHGVPAALAVAALGAVLWWQFGWRHALLPFAAAGVFVLTWLIKEAVGRSRPGGPLDSPSFPRGHTAWAIAVFGLALVLAVQRRAWAPAVACLLVVGAMGPSRVLLGVHWLSDVIAGYAIGLIWLIGVLVVGLPWARRESDRPRS
jgi:membrane-associated phospholipid phosphatase